jgi:predicted ATP-dependent endonuclease of OLD family
MGYGEYPRGSEWRRWDLQSQTILDDGYTSLASYSQELKDRQPQKWLEYIAKVGGEENALRFDSKEYFADGSVTKTERCRNYTRNLFAFLEVFSPEVACVGTTDHNYWDDELLDVLVEYSRKAKRTIISGVEINCNGIHMLLFFGKPPCSQANFSEGITTLLKRFDITGRKSGAVLTVTTHDPKKIIDQINNEDGLLIFPHCNSDNGLFQERGKTDRSVLADLFNHQKMNLLQSQNRQSMMAVAEYIKKNEHLVADCSCHISSDSRALRDFGRPDNDGNFLWVKADPTFEGLKQIIYEPERIYVGPEKPEQKKPYFVIDQVRFLDNTKNIRFSSDPIEINQNLTTIIGGKSTGKSLLLYYIAKTIDPSEVQRRTSIDELVNYDFDEDPNFNFEVVWEDKHKNFLKVAEGASGAETQERKILYIPQKYLNTLSETNFQSREALNKFVLDVVLQDRDVREQYEKTSREIKSASRDIPSQVAELFLQQDEMKRSEEELKQLGDVKGIRDYIKPLQQQVDGIKTKSGFDEIESKNFETLTAREKQILAELSNLGEDKKTLRDFDTALAGHLEGLTGAVEEYEGYLNDSEIKKVFIKELQVVDSFAPILVTSAKNVFQAIDLKIQRLKEELAKIKIDLAPLLGKVNLQSELKAKTEAIKAEEQKLNEIAIKKAALKKKKDGYDRKVSAVIDAYKEIMGRYDQMRNDFKRFESKFGDIALRVLVGFKSESFNDNVVREYLNRRDLKRLITEKEWGEDCNYFYDSAKHLTNIEKVFRGLLERVISSVKNRPPRDAATKLMEDYFYLDFQIFYKGDSFDKMSPGKKGLVLLQVLVNLSDEEWPILLDQPEDDLDNRSVYEDLVGFLKKKKIQRQILIVTHNPNLVVGADAEEIIVANQAGQEINRENKKFQFEYVSGSLENSFELDADKEPAILLRKGIRQHVCEVLEGGKEAFQKREQKYDFPAGQR